MLAILFFILGLLATKVSIWQSGLWGQVMGMATPQTPDYTIAGLSFTAALIFFGLCLANRINKREIKSSILLD
jgi:hypothetical protein